MLIQEHEIDPLHDFPRVRDRIAGYLEQLRFFGQQVEFDSQRIAEINQVLERSRSNTFTVAVVGEFNRGKSTFINALLGKAVLPADVLPSTAAINRIRYGLDEVVELRYRPDETNQVRRERIAVDQLVEYVTKTTDESEERAKSIAEAIVTLRQPLLEQIEVIDTPGLNDTQEISDVTYGVLPEVDAAIMLVIPSAPFGQTEADFLNFLLAHDVGRVIFVVNQIDKVRNADDRVRLVNTITERIRESTQSRAEELYGIGSEAYERYLRRIGKIQVHGLSGREALRGRVNNDAAKLAASGFPEFEAHLRSFLSRQRGALRLKIMCDRVLASGAQLLQAASVRQGALTMSQAEFEHVYQASCQQLDALQARLDDQMRRIDIAAENTRQRALVSIGNLHGTLVEAAAHEIDNYPLSTVNLGAQNTRAAIRDMRRAAQRAVEQQAQIIADKIQQSISKELEVEIERLQALAEEVDDGLRSITLQFDPGAEKYGSFLSQMTFGRLSSLRNTEHFVLVALGLSIDWTLMLVLEVAARFGGERLMPQIIVEKQINLLRAHIKEEVQLAIEQRIGNQSDAPRLQVQEHIRTTFERLRGRAQDEIGGAVTQMRTTVESLARERAGVQARGDEQRRVIEQICNTVQILMDDTRSVGTAVDRAMQD